MQFDLNQLNRGGQLDKVLSALPYPLDKEELVEQARSTGANPQMIMAIEQTLPDDVEFRSADQVKKGLQSGMQFH